MILWGRDVSQSCNNCVEKKERLGYLRYNLDYLSRKYSTDIPVLGHGPRGNKVVHLIRENDDLF